MAVVLLRRAVAVLSELATDHGLLSSEAWPCLEQSAGGEAPPSLRNGYLPATLPLLEARILLAEALVVCAEGAPVFGHSNSLGIHVYI